MRERGGVWIAHGAGAADRAVVDAGDKVRVPPEPAVLRAAAAVARTRAVLRVLRRLRQRGPVAAVPSGRRAAAVPHRGLGGLPGRQRAVRRGDRRGADGGRYAGVHPGLSPGARRGARCARAGRRRGPRSSGTFHGRTPIGCASARGGARLLAGLLANDFLAFQLERDRRNFVCRGRGRAAGRRRLGGAADRFDGRASTVVVGADRRRLRPHPGVGADPALGQRTARLRQALRSARAGLIGLGVDRLDYTKGIPERLDALDRVFDAAARSARATDVRADWRAVAVRRSGATARSKRRSIARLPR